jgi:hypothetical protein
MSQKKPLVQDCGEIILLFGIVSLPGFLVKPGMPAFSGPTENHPCPAGKDKNAPCLVR